MFGLHPTTPTAAYSAPMSEPKYPDGSVTGLCGAGATNAALCLAFLAGWGFQDPKPWDAKDLFVAVPLVLAIAAYGMTPFLATRPVPAPQRLARRAFVAGLCCMLTAVVTALVVVYVDKL